MGIEELKEKAEILSKEIKQAMDKFWEETEIFPEVIIEQIVEQTECSELKYIKIKVDINLC